MADILIMAEKPELIDKYRGAFARQTAGFSNKYYFHTPFSLGGVLSLIKSQKYDIVVIPYNLSGYPDNDENRYLHLEEQDVEVKTGVDILRIVSEKAEKKVKVITSNSEGDLPMQEFLRKEYEKFEVIGTISPFEKESDRDLELAFARCTKGHITPELVVNNA